jgi:hypothetical protein
MSKATRKHISESVRATAAKKRAAQTEAEVAELLPTKKRPKRAKKVAPEG